MKQVFSTKIIKKYFVKPNTPPFETEKPQIFSTLIALVYHSLRFSLTFNMSVAIFLQIFSSLSHANAIGTMYRRQQKGKGIASSSKGRNKVRIVAHVPKAPVIPRGQT